MPDETERRKITLAEAKEMATEALHQVEASRRQLAEQEAESLAYWESLSSPTESPLTYRDTFPGMIF